MLIPQCSSPIRTFPQSHYRRGLKRVAIHHQYTNPNRSRLGFFSGDSRQFPRTVADSCKSLRTSPVSLWSGFWPLSTLSKPFFSPATLTKTCPKSAKVTNHNHIDQRVTRGRINRLFFCIGRRRKPPRFGEWRMARFPLPLMIRLVSARICVYLGGAGDLNTDSFRSSE